MLAFERLFKVAYQGAIKPVLFKMHPDDAHDGMITFGSFAQKIPPVMWMLNTMMRFEHPALEQEVMGTYFKNPIGLGAGLDKNAALAGCLEGIGLGLATFGSTTARPCAGNPKPWFHRLPQYGSLMVHVGLANQGSEIVSETVRAAHEASEEMNVVVSIARTNDKQAADDTEGIADYVTSMKRVVGKCAMIEVNISCPNTFKGEPFNDPQRLDLLLTELDKVERDVPVVLKMPNDKTWDVFKTLLDVIVQHNVQGVTISNLRKDRDGMNIDESWDGNLSGAPTWKKSNYLIENTYREYGNKLAIIGLGGVFTAEQAYQKIRLGSSLVEFVTAFMFKGPQVGVEIKRGLVKLLERDGFSNISEAIGADVKNVTWH